MANVALNKPAKASSYFMPFTASRAVDGSTAPTNRWVSTSVPAWIMVDLTTPVWVNRWVVKNMSAVAQNGWPSPVFNMQDYRLQGSDDGINWTDINTITGNTAPITDKPFTAVKHRYFRVYVTKGIELNPGLASIVDFELYDVPPTPNTLNGLVMKDASGATVAYQPNFASGTVNYTAEVLFNTPSVTIIPTATDTNARITVNGVPVISGQTSAPVSLTAGAVTSIPVVVTPVIGNPQTYTIAVTRASSPYLTGITVKLGRATIILTPDFNKSTYVYSGSSSTTTSVLITVVAEDAVNSTIKINGLDAVSGTALSVPVTSGQLNAIPIVVTSKIGIDSKTYTINLTVE